MSKQTLPSFTGLKINRLWLPSIFTITPISSGKLKTEFNFYTSNYIHLCGNGVIFLNFVEVINVHDLRVNELDGKIGEDKPSGGAASRLSVTVSRPNGYSAGEKKTKRRNRPAVEWLPP